MAYDNSATPALCCIGALLRDDIAIPRQLLHPGVSNPVDWQLKLGGVAGNVARAASLASKTSLISAIGNDMSSLINDHSLAGVDGRWLFRDSPNDRYTAVLTESGELFVGLASTALTESLQSGDVEPHLPYACKAYILDANLNQACLTQLVGQLKNRREHPLIVALPVSPEKSRRWLACASDVDLLFCNRREAAALTELNVESHIDHLIEGLGDCGFSSIVLTDAANPITVVQNGVSNVIDVPASTISGDVNGAGDALTGATLCHYLHNLDLTSSVQHAGIVAAQCVLEGKPIHYPVPGTAA